MGQPRADVGLEEEKSNIENDASDTSGLDNAEQTESEEDELEDESEEDELLVGEIK